MKRSIEKRCVRALVLAGLFAAPAAPVFAEQARTGFEISTGLDYAAGDYGGGEETTIFYAPMTARLRGERWRVETTAPFLQIEGSANVFAAPGLPVVVGPDGTAPIETRSGFGDVILSGTISSANSARFPRVELTAKTKLATAEDGLGTGQADYSAKVDVFQNVGDRLTLMGGVGYQWLGDPEDFDLEDGVIAMGGFNYKSSDRVHAGLLFDYRQAAVSDLDDQLSAAPYGVWRLGGRVALIAYGAAGLTETSPEFGAGVQLLVYR